MNKDEIRDLIVCVNGGSGIIFQPANENCTYVLTAKHVFDDIDHESYGGKAKVHYFSSDTNSFTPLDEIELIEGNNYFPHEQELVDVAIVKISRIPGRDNLIRKENPLIGFDGSLLLGLPFKRREQYPEMNQNWFRDDDVVKMGLSREHKRQEAILAHAPGQEVLEGSSGGGIVKIMGDYLLLLGIQSSVVSEDEGLGAIEFTPTHVLKEITDKYPNELEPIEPCYMGSFEFLRDSAFRLEVEAFDEEKIANTRNYLKLKALDVVDSGVTPKSIRGYFKNRLLVEGSEEPALSTRDIWKVWLEFLTIMNFVKQNTYNEDSLDELFSSLHLKYSDTNEDWSHLFREKIGKSDYTGLKDEGKVLIGTNKPPINPHIPRAKLLANIALVPDVGKFKTDTGKDPLASFHFYHTDYLLKTCILNKLETYAAIESVDELHAALKAEYEAFVNG